MAVMQLCLAGLRCIHRLRLEFCVAQLWLGARQWHGVWFARLWLHFLLIPLPADAVCFLLSSMATMLHFAMPPDTMVPPPLLQIPPPGRTPLFRTFCLFLD